MKVVLFAGILGLLANQVLTASQLTLARGGQAQFSLLTTGNASPTIRFAAAELQHYLLLITGTAFEVDTNGTKPFIFLGIATDAPSTFFPSSTQAKLPADGYLLAERQGNLFVLGGNDRGAEYGVYALLERLGCRWLAPALDFYGGAHEFVPKSETLRLSLDEEVCEQPALKYRKLYVEEGHSHNTTNLLQMIEWMPKRRFNTLVVPLNYAGGNRVKWDNWRESLTPELRRRGLWIEVGGHGYENYLNAGMEDGELFAKHPEWFGQNEDGQRIKLAHAVFCTSNREARDYLSAKVVRYLEAHPEIEIFDFWPPDGAKWCQCPACKALGTPSDRQALLLAEVSAAVHKVHPGVRFETIAYAACVAPPAQAKLDPGVLLDFCPINQCFEVQIGDASSTQNADYVRQLKAWRAAFTGDISVYSYYRKYAWRSLPNLIPHYMQRDLLFYRELGVGGISSYAEPGDWAAYELNHYVLGALAWDPSAPVDALVREFAKARFGSEAELALKTYQALEENVRHFCSLPGTTLKAPADYQKAADNFDALLAKLELAQTSNKAFTAPLRRLRLTVEYARRDLLLQKARAEKGDVTERKRQLQELTSFIAEHDQEGVFLTDRMSAAKQGIRYGLGKQ